MTMITSREIELYDVPSVRAHRPDSVFGESIYQRPMAVWLWTFLTATDDRAADTASPFPAIVLL